MPRAGREQRAGGGRAAARGRRRSPARRAREAARAHRPRRPPPTWTAPTTIPNTTRIWKAWRRALDQRRVKGRTYSSSGGRASSAGRNSPSSRRTSGTVAPALARRERVALRGGILLPWTGADRRRGTDDGPDRGIRLAARTACGSCTPTSSTPTRRRRPACTARRRSTPPAPVPRSSGPARSTIHPDAKTGAAPPRRARERHLRRAAAARGCAGASGWSSWPRPGPGDFIYVPPFVPHQEINASPDDAAVLRPRAQRSGAGRGQPGPARVEPNPSRSTGSTTSTRRPERRPHHVVQGSSTGSPSRGCAARKRGTPALLPGLEGARGPGATRIASSGPTSTISSSSFMRPVPPRSRRPPRPRRDGG